MVSGVVMVVLSQPHHVRLGSSELCCWAYNAVVVVGVTVALCVCTNGSDT